MQKNINLQNDVNDKILKAHVNFKKSPRERISEPYIQTRLTNLEQLWDRFTNVHQDIVSESGDWAQYQNTAYCKDNMYENTEEAYMDYKTALMNLQSQYNSGQTGQSVSNGGGNTSCTSLKLPKISIPHFSGKYSEWVTFRDLFRSLVHSNPSLDDVQRLHYLKAYLTGEAEQLIRQLPITAANYLECWNQLEARYNNKKYLANSILKRLLGQKSASSESAATLKDLADTTADCLHGLKNIGVKVETWDVIVIHIISNKLDMETRKQWELRVSLDNSDVLPTFEQFREFLQSRFRALESIESTTRFRPSNPTQNYPVKHKVLHVANIVCEYCTEDHKLFTCKNFTKDDVIKRRDFVFSKRLCFNCLGSNHSARFCPSKMTCRVCRGKHHSLLHPTSSGGVGNHHNFNTGVSTPGEGTSGSSAGKSPAYSSAEDSAAVVACFGQLPVQRQVFLATAIVQAESSKGRRQYIRALLDQGSQASFISEAMVQNLGLKKYPAKGIVSGLEGKHTTVSRFMAEIKIHSRFNDNKVIKIQAYVLNSITTLLPNWKIELEEMSWLDESFPLADPQYHTPNKINMLIGAEVYSQIIENGVRKGPRGNILAQATSLGWIVSGTSQISQSASVNVIAMHSCIEDNDLMKKFGEMEADPMPHKRIMTKEKVSCDTFLAKTIQRDTDGRYVVKLPFKEDRPECADGDSRLTAEKKLNGLYSRFKRDEDQKEKYKNVIGEYLHLGFMVKIPETEKNNKEVVPHHPVVRCDNDTTMVQLIYDKSCKFHPISLPTDFVKMYCEVNVAEEDTNYQRLFWKNDAQAKTEDYRLLRVTFGTAAAPYLALKSLQQLAQDEEDEYPKAAKKVLTEFKIDYLRTGCESVKEEIIVHQEMNDLLKKGGFELQKWMSNSEELLKAIKQTWKGQEDVGEELKLKIDKVQKGLTWNRRTDDIHYSVTPSVETPPVIRRKNISHIARLYDQLGWAAPCVIVAKILIRRLWIAALAWADEMTGKLLDDWNNYRDYLPMLTQIQIPRWLGTTSNYSLVELHEFSDASKLAFSAAVYLRRFDAAGKIHVTLATAKTKVAPIKQVSIPRLELCRAVLVTRLLVEVADTLKIPKTNIRAWIDSTVVLAWIYSHPSRWQTFVANRVSEILTTLDSSKWAHVSSGQNSADCASRALPRLSYSIIRS